MLISCSLIKVTPFLRITKGVNDRKIVLFVGGPLDGRRISVPIGLEVVEVVEMPDVDDPLFTFVNYRAEYFLVSDVTYCEPEIVRIFVKEGVTLGFE